MASKEPMEPERHDDREPSEDDSGFRKTVVSAVIQAVVREALDAILRMAGRGGPLWGPPSYRQGPRCGLRPRRGFLLVYPSSTVELALTL